MAQFCSHTTRICGKRCRGFTPFFILFPLQCPLCSRLQPELWLPCHFRLKRATSGHHHTITKCVFRRCPRRSSVSLLAAFPHHYFPHLSPTTTRLRLLPLPLFSPIHPPAGRSSIPSSAQSGGKRYAPLWALQAI